ncbi:hypothetical protein GCM10010393_33680 [Streptomyces gobitricini]|uniref:Uncharacterized protein n=1 Tax=Streptomyces gobitricini TaxID=68211 RepID=A0ABN3MAW1_9ACTN
MRAAKVLDKPLFLDDSMPEQPPCPIECDDLVAISKDTIAARGTHEPCFPAVSAG